MALVDSAADLFSMLGMPSVDSSFPAPKALPVAAGILDMPVPPSAHPPASWKPENATPKPAQVGCGMNSDTKTVFVSGDFEGDSSRLDVVMNQSRRAATSAAKRGNRVMYAFTGNIVPDLHSSSETGNAMDSVNRILEMAKAGIKLGDSMKVSPDDVILMSGPRELAWLRLANPNSDSREIVRYTDEDARRVLTRGTPMLDATKSSKTNTSRFQAYNRSLRLLDEIEDEGVGVAMMLKMVSMTHLTLRSAGLAAIFVKRLQNFAGQRDEASLVALLTFLSNFKGTVEEGVAKLFDKEGKLTPEGLGIQPAAIALVDSVLEFANTVATLYTRHSKLIHCVVNGEFSNGEGGLWLTPKGSAFVVGKMPSGVDDSHTRVNWKAGPEHSVEWSKALNREFRHFLRDFLKGDNSMSIDLYRAFMVLSLDSPPSPLPLEELSGTLVGTCSGATSNASLPFGTIQRRVLVKPSDHSSHSDVVKVLDQWTTVNTSEYTPSTYWSVATWCGGTKADLSPATPLLNLNERIETHLRSVSVVLASLLTARIKERTVGEYGVAGLDGVLGPVVVHQKQSMRALAFSHEGFDTAFVVLLPEVFVQWSLDYMNDEVDHATDKNAPMLATEGFLSLPDDAIVPLGFPGLPEADIEALRAELGTRVWALPKRRSCKYNTAFSPADHAAIDLMANSTSDSSKHASPGFTVYHTLQSSEDPLAGTRVALSPVPGMPNRMTITSGSVPSHDMYRVVAVHLP